MRPTHVKTDKATLAALAEAFRQARPLLRQFYVRNLLPMRRMVEQAVAATDQELPAMHRRWRSLREQADDAARDYLLNHFQGDHAVASAFEYLAPFSNAILDYCEALAGQVQRPHNPAAQRALRDCRAALQEHMLFYNEGMEPHVADQHLQQTENALRYLIEHAFAEAKKTKSR